MDSLKEVIISMEDRGIIINKGKGSTESFYTNDNSLVNIVQDGNDSLTCDDATNTAMTFIDESFNEILLNKIKTEVKSVLNTELNNLLKDSNWQKIIKVTEPKENNNDLLINSLNDEIAFLRRELESKDCIIKLLVNEPSRKSGTVISEENETSIQHNTITPNNADPLISSDDELVEKNDVTVDETTFTVENRKNAKRKNRSITVLGDSMIKNIEAHKMKQCMKPREKVYIKTFSGATVADMYDYSKPTKKHKPDVIILHAGTNDLKLTNSPDFE